MEVNLIPTAAPDLPEPDQAISWYCNKCGNLPAHGPEHERSPGVLCNYCAVSYGPWWSRDKLTARDAMWIGRMDKLLAALRESEETCSNLVRALREEIDGPTFMGEPVLPTKADAPAAQPEPVTWLGPYKTAAEALDALRRAVAEVIGTDPETWPSHGNAPLAIAAAMAMRHAAYTAAPPPAAQPAPLDSITDEASLRFWAGKLIARAHSIGLVVTIDRKPLRPLAMGHHVPIVEVWPVRNAEPDVLELTLKGLWP
jgi:hypothetical protein